MPKCGDSHTTNNATPSIPRKLQLSVCGFPRAFSLLILRWEGRGRSRCLRISLDALLTHSCGVSRKKELTSAPSILASVIFAQALKIGKRTKKTCDTHYVTATQVIAEARGNSEKIPCSTPSVLREVGWRRRISSHISCDVPCGHSGQPSHLCLLQARGHRKGLGRSDKTQM